MVKSDLFESFLDEAANRGIAFAPLGHLLSEVASIPPGAVTETAIDGRDGLVCVQAAR